MPQPKAVSFMLECGFDFNKCFRDGVPFMPLSERDELLMAELQQSERRRCIPIGGPLMVDFVGQLVDEVTAWLDGNDPEMLLPAVNNHLRAVQRQVTGSALHGATFWYCFSPELIGSQALRPLSLFFPPSLRLTSSTSRRVVEHSPALTSPTMFDTRSWKRTSSGP